MRQNDDDYNDDDGNDDDGNDDDDENDSGNGNVISRLKCHGEDMRHTTNESYPRFSN